MEVRIHIHPDQGSIGSLNPRGLDALVNQLSENTIIFAAATLDNSKFKAAKERYDKNIIVAELPSADMYNQVCDKLGWEKLKNVEIRGE